MISEHGKVEELWLSDNKTHCIATVNIFMINFLKIYFVQQLSDKESVAKLKEKVNRVVWPKGGGTELEVEFIDDETAKALKEYSRKTPVVFINSEKTTKIEVLNSNDSQTARNQSRSYESGSNNLISSKGHASKRLKISRGNCVNCDQQSSFISFVVKSGRSEREVMEVEEEAKNPAEAISELDKLFRKTKAQPAIYYLPLTQQQVKLSIL